MEQSRADGLGFILERDLEVDDLTDFVSQGRDRQKHRSPYDLHYTSRRSSGYC